MKKRSADNGVEIKIIHGFLTIHSNIKPSPAEQLDLWREAFRACVTYRNGLQLDIDSTPSNADSRDPPKFAEFLLTALATTHQAEAAIGDLNERFADERQKLGRQRAARLYWARALRSLWPLLRRAIGKALRWGAVIAAMRRLF
jgi:hypothetical protein